MLVEPLAWPPVYLPSVPLLLVFIVDAVFPCSTEYSTCIPTKVSAC